MGRRFEILNDDPKTLGEIIDEMRREGGNSLTATTLQKSIDTLNSLPSSNSRALVINEVIDVFLENDLIYLANRFGDEALDSAFQVKVTSEKVKTLSRLASTFLKHEFESKYQEIFGYGLKEAEKIKDDQKLVDIFISVAEEQLDLGLVERAKKNLERALRPALNLSKDGKNIVPLTLVAEMKARMGDDEVEELCRYALALTSDFNTREDEKWIKCIIGKTFLRLGETEKAKTLIEEINQSGAGDIYLMELGIALSDEGLWENALKIVGDIESDDIRDTLIRIIATDLIHKALVDQALKLVETIEDRWERDQIYKELIKNLLEKGEYERVHEYLVFMENEEIKSITNKDISLSYLKDGKLQRAEDHALKARELAEKSKKTPLS
ncbi:MAG: tetratricopeptide repeat protein [Thermoplasmata archaeon]